MFQYWVPFITKGRLFWTFEEPSTTAPQMVIRKIHRYFSSTDCIFMHFISNSHVRWLLRVWGARPGSDILYLAQRCKIKGRWHNWVNLSKHLLTQKNLNNKIIASILKMSIDCKCMTRNIILASVWMHQVKVTRSKTKKWQNCLSSRKQCG